MKWFDSAVVQPEEDGPRVCWFPVMANKPDGDHAFVVMYWHSNLQQWQSYKGVVVYWHNGDGGPAPWWSDSELTPPK